MGGCMGLGLITLGHVVGWCLPCVFVLPFGDVSRTPLDGAGRDLLKAELFNGDYLLMGLSVDAARVNGRHGRDFEL